jgi:hypothetical protein
MFLPNDIYTTSGSVKLFHCWTDKVTKYDSSSFYNWEQDNLPIYDLDERTFYLWEQLGYHTSSIPGVALVVSADAPDSAVACNKNVFRTLSAALEAVPQVINYPIIIEVASFGLLGDLVLNNHKFGPRGSLEIINRNFSRQEYSVSNVAGLQTPVVSSAYYNGTNTYNYVSSFNDNGLAGSIPAITPLKGFLDSSCLSISSTVFSSTYDSRLSSVGTLNGYVSIWKPILNNNKSTLIVDTKNIANPYVGNTYGLAFTPYVYNSDSADAISLRDASTIDYLNSNTQLYTVNDTISEVNPNNAFNALYFGNKLFKIKVNNCDGPIFIRNFFLDGSGVNVTNNQNGVEINNCPNIYLENIVSTRFRKAGFYFTNSVVNLLRSCVANRNYDFDSAGSRITGLFANRRYNISYNDTNGYLQQDLGAGMVINNSIVNVSSTRDWETARYSEALGASVSAIPNAYGILEFNENANGIVLNNSQLIGGDSIPISAPSSSLYVAQTIFDANNNVNYGIISNNSKISLNGKLRLIENLNGAKINSSEFEVEQVDCIYNQHTGIEFNNSNALYNKNLKKFHTAGTYTANAGGYSPLYFLSNGHHLILNNSKLKPMMTSALEDRYPDLWFVNTIGLPTGQLTESIKVTNNSELVLISPKITRNDSHGKAEYSKKGSELNCVNNSKATLRGTRYFPTRVNGPTTRSKQKKLAAISCNQNSIIDINGPTIIAQFGIDLLADKNSTLNICPPKADMDGTLDFSSIDLYQPKNHTMVELHATRSCVVVDNESTINMKDLGSYRSRWNVTGAFDASGPDYGGTTTLYSSVFVSAGSLQFYPNPNSNSLNAALSVTSTLANPFTSYSNGYGSLIALNSSPLNFSSVTYGGMCLRAVNNSIVNVNNVNFPCGWWNPSAPYYDSTLTFDSGGACYRPFIWNIADTSQLKASFLSVSGLYPRLAGYIGPFGYWTSAAGNVAAYGAPSSTPDTSSMSILDIFGQNPSGIAFTTTSLQNYGPFRLYFGVNPFVNTLVNSNGTGYGIINQIYSQGYQPSASLVCSGGLSSIYNMALQRNSSNNIVASGFYYGSGVMDNQGFTRVIIDESASETFANAKHCAAGRSGNARLVSIYYPYTLAPHGDSRGAVGITSVNMFDIERDN